MTMKPLLIHLAIFFSLFISKEAFCIELISGFNYEKNKSIPFSYSNMGILDGVDIRPLSNYDRLHYYQEESKKADYSRQQLRMVFNAKKYDLNEPIFARVFLKNLSNDDLLYNVTWGMQYSHCLSFLIVHEDGDQIEVTNEIARDFYAKVMSVRGGSVAYQFLRAGREIEIDLNRVYGDKESFEQICSSRSGDHPFTRPGKYRIVAFFSPQSEKIEAKPVEIVIREKQYELPLESFYANVIPGQEDRYPPPKQIKREDLWKYSKDGCGNLFFYTNHFRMTFDITKVQPYFDKKIFHQGESVNLQLYMIADGEFGMYHFFPDQTPYKGMQLTLFTPEGQKTSKVISESKETVELNDGVLDLRTLFDLLQPGNYRVSAKLSSVRPGQRFVPPLESNELEFEIEGK